ncbi:alpha/beta hydrolase family protein [Neptuniibacter caesariensis]|uniref:Peptidase S9, prolyl oligopeptidase active site region n=1 Tax=Neptuniibacter caesariensis TaxID=207954 RepID=A0A7U8GTB4_NEPCE|nr:prolyl oligopeptidase family serine peptidase [Neptuniibacter caesariensis]EAR62122.1 Peptidase S9, prolyl oligopeptidase active site region [Oceanospirillum sp. MED92] [Neptuniibacter caesariensis]
MLNALPGFWQSELSAEKALAVSTEFSQIQVDDSENVYWVELRPHQSGCSFICKWNPETEVVTQLTPDTYSVQSKVHEYGGRAWCLTDDQIFFINAADQQLYSQCLKSPELITQLTNDPDIRFIEPIYDSSRQRIICVAEYHDSEDVENKIVSINLESKCIDVLVQGSDFYAYPVLDSENHQLAYICWNHPEQPWTATQCCVATLDREGDVTAIHNVAGLRSSESVSQPLFVNNQLYLISDRSGWWNIYHWNQLTGELAGSVLAPEDMMSSPWQSGLRHYAVIPSTKEPLVCSIRIKHEGCEIWLDDRKLDLPFSFFSALSCSENFAYCVASSGDTKQGVIRINLKSGKYQVISGCEKPLTINNCSLPEPLSFSSGDVTSYGYLYPPKNVSYQLSHDESAPLIIFLHGGPTAATYPVFNTKIQFWTQRGFAVLDLNYRGSSNYGRQYRFQLKHQWGVIEIEDINVAVHELVKRSDINPEAIFIRGNSSGGLSALNALCELDCFTAGASLYGVTDPLVLNGCTHKFESHYLEWLIGSADKDKGRYRERAPINNADKIDCPVIFFQGEQDKVVLPEQTRHMVNELRLKGVQVEAYYFPDEAHGFKKSENAQTVLNKELEFYQCRLGG